MANNFDSNIKRNDLGQALVPDEISQEIIQTMPEKSVMLTRAKRMTMSARKKTQPVLATLRKPTGSPREASRRPPKAVGRT